MTLPSLKGLQPNRAGGWGAERQCPGARPHAHNGDGTVPANVLLFARRRDKPDDASTCARPHLCKTALAQGSPLKPQNK